MDKSQSELTIADRIAGPTSPFFKPLVKWGAIIAALVVGLLAFQGSLAEQGIVLPPLAAHIIEVLGYVSAAVAGVSKLTVNLTPKQ